MKVVEFRFLSYEDKYDLRWNNWSRTYEYTKILSRLREVNPGSIHNTACGFDPLHLDFANELLSISADTTHSDVIKQKFQNYRRYNITNKCGYYYDAVINISVVEHLRENCRITVLDNLYEQINPGGHLFLTFDYPSVDLEMVEEWTKSKCSDVQNRLSGCNSVIPNIYAKDLNIVYLEIIKEKNNERPNFEKMPVKIN